MSYFKGLSGRGSLPNLIIYLLFIGLMCTIVLNLFVGIAVDDIKTILDEADIQLICMKCLFASCLQEYYFVDFHFLFGFINFLLIFKLINHFCIF